MRLIRIEITGFKSFCDKTVIHLVQDGISIVVGPNGCGKSNIVDAVRWTLGEQSAKHLRGTAMEDVIFNGSSVRQPVGLAQVSLIFSNPEHNTLTKYSEFSEIVITRRLYRSGESQYLINKTACRLTDIRELFMDTGIGGKGYSIIEQGKIDQIVTSRPEDRRLIIDEAAGIVKFKSRRKDAERKFATTKQNLLRVEDILSELQNQEESLKSQVDKAEEYLHAKGRLERLQQCIQAKQWFKLKMEAERLEKNRETNLQRQADRQLIVTDLSVKESALNLDIERELRTLEDKRVELQSRKETIIKLESRLESDNLTKDNLDEWQAKGREEINLLQKQIETIAFQMGSHQTLAENLKKDINQSTERAEQLEEREKINARDLSDLRLELENRQAEQIKTVAELTSDRNQLIQLNTRRTEIELKKEQINEQILNIVAENTTVNLERERLEKSLQHTITDRETCWKQVEEDQKTIDALQEKVRQKNSQLASLSEESLRIQNRHSSLLELTQNHEEFDSATKNFLDSMDSDPGLAEKIGFVGTLAELATSAEPLSKEASALLNRHFNLLVFKSVKTLEAVVQTVHKLDADQMQVFFMDLSLSKTSDASSELPDIPLAGSYQTIEEPIFQYSLKQLQKAEGLIDPSANIITPEKIFLIGTPGKSNPAARYLQRRSELTELENKLDKVNVDLESLEIDLGQDKKQLTELSQEADQQKKNLVQLDLSKLSTQKELDAISQESNRIENHDSMLKEDQEQITFSLEKNKADTLDLIENIKKGEKNQQTLQDSIQDFQKQIDETTGSKQSFTDDLQQLRIHLASLDEKETNNQATLDRLDMDQEQRREQLQELSSHSNHKKDQRDDIISSIKTAKGRLPELLDDLTKFEGQMKIFTDKAETDRAQLLAIQNSITVEQQKINQVRDRTHKQDIKLAQLNQETINISDNLYADDRITPQELLDTFDVGKFDIEKESENINVLKQYIGGMEDINLAAKKEYDVLIERIEFLTNQSADLNQSIKALEDSIARINQESKRRFRETFNKINEQFSKTFPQLFDGGEAFLRMTNEEDMLESGVDIIAKPPGKKLQNMNLLSGGEKALTAIALVFSIFQIKPSPFCLLDEVDAPLDDANNNRFNQHVKFLTSNSQFVIITHNKKTMEIGDALYGVTMEEPGISKIVSVEMTQAASDSLQKAG